MESIHDHEEDEWKTKKQKVGGEENLLEELRKMTCWTEEPPLDNERLMNAVLRNQNLFPSKFQPIMPRLKEFARDLFAKMVRLEQAENHTETSVFFFFWNMRLLPFSLARISEILVGRGLKVTSIRKTKSSY